MALVIVVAGAGLLAAGAGAGRATPNSVEIQAVFDTAGNPLLVANFNGEGPTPSWTVCSPAGTCSAAPTTPHATLEPGPEPAGTGFVASVTADGQTYSASVTWQGQVRALAPPRVVGPARFGAPVTAAAGEWAGGWGDEFDQLGVEACRTRTGTGCVVLSGGEYGCPGQSARATVGGWLPGMYLFAYDLRSAREEACGGVGYSYPGAVPPWPWRRPIVARSAAAGPVTGPPRPRVSILPTARVADGRVLVATVHCSTHCHVSLLVEGSRSGSVGRVTVTGSATVGVPRRQLLPGRVSVHLHVDDGPEISGWSRLLP